jgi:hypothetical protein
MRTLLSMLAMAMVLGSLGCGRGAKKDPEPAPVAKAEPKKEPPKVAPAPKEDPPAPTKAPIRGGSLVRRVDEADVKNMLRNLHLATTNFETTRNRYPNSREELEDSYEKNPAINQALKEGDLVYLWKARKSEEPAILAYEGQADTLGRRVVLLTNGDLLTVNEEEFRKMPKVQTAK